MNCAIMVILNKAHSQGKHMNEIDFFLLQIKNKADVSTVKMLERHLRCLSEPESFEKTIAELKKNHPDRFMAEWVEHLIAEIKPYYKLDEYDEYTNPLVCFIATNIKKLNGGRSFIMVKQFSLDNFAKEELENPNMQWVKVLFERYHELKEAYPNEKTIRLLRVHPTENISDELAIKLSRMFEDDEWFMGMEFTEFVRYYTKSREHFEVENEKLNPEYAKQMIDTLKVWNTDEMRDLEDNLYWLSRNYNFHPLHHPFLKRFIEDCFKAS